MRPAGQAHRRRGGPWSLDRLASGRSHGLAPPFSAGRMLVRPIDRAVEAMPFVVDVGPQDTEHPFPLALLRPAIEPIEHRLPRSELGGQVPPRCSRPPPPKHGLDKVSVILTGLAGRVVRLQERLDLRPLLVRELQAHAHSSPLEPKTRPMANFPAARVQGQALVPEISR